LRHVGNTNNVSVQGCSSISEVAYQELENFDMAFRLSRIIMKITRGLGRYRIVIRFNSFAII